MVDVAPPGLTPSLPGGSQPIAGTSRLKELQESLKSTIPESLALEMEPHTWRYATSQERLDFKLQEEHWKKISSTP